MLTCVIFLIQSSFFYVNLDFARTSNFNVSMFLFIFLQMLRIHWELVSHHTHITITFQFLKHKIVLEMQHNIISAHKTFWGRKKRNFTAPQNMKFTFFCFNLNFWYSLEIILYVCLCSLYVSIGSSWDFYVLYLKSMLRLKDFFKGLQCVSMIFNQRWSSQCLPFTCLTKV
jgi:hypothetical protein